MKKFFLKSSLCIALSSIFMTSAIIPTFAAINQNNVMEKTINNLTPEELNSMINDFKSAEWDNSFTQEKSIVSSTIKKVAKWILANKTKITNIVKKYIPYWTFGNIATDFLNDVLNGVIEVDESIDNFIYNFVDLIPGLKYDTKKIIANLIRIVLPF